MTGAGRSGDVLLVGADDVTIGALAGILNADETIGAIVRATDAVSAGPLARRAAVTLIDASGLDPITTVAAIGLVQAAAPLTQVVVVADDGDPALVRSVLDAGALSLLLRTADARQVRATVAAAMEGRGLLDVEVVRPVIDVYAILLAEARRRDRGIIESLAAAVEAKDSVTSRHLRAVSRLACDLARLIDPALVANDDFLFGCLLHDVGKIGVPEHILGKPGSLTDEEWAVMRCHPETGAMVVSPLGLAPTVTAVVRHHHERWDGTGYPDGLAREEIPLVARIFSVCDALEAMTAPRPYRAPLAPAVAFERVRVAAGQQFDPDVVAALVRSVEAGELDIVEPFTDVPEVLPGRRFERVAAADTAELAAEGFAGPRC
jgi:putative nucleotidyltransferase with HDIG domain